MNAEIRNMEEIEIAAKAYHDSKMRIDWDNTCDNWKELCREHVANQKVTTMEICKDCQKTIEPGQTSYVANPAAGVIHHYHSKCGDPFGIKRAVVAERERCAKIADAVAALQTEDDCLRDFASDIAAEIRSAP